MKKVENKIALKGQLYATPRTESVEIISQGNILSGSGMAKGINLNPLKGGTNATI